MLASGQYSLDQRVNKWLLQPQEKQRNQKEAEDGVERHQGNTCMEARKRKTEMKVILSFLKNLN